jgi:major membrane immunogen (membrane-anchored lipoprotein)
MTRCLPSLCLPSLRRWSAALVVLVLLAACSATQDVDLSNTAIAHFRELMTAQKFDQIYSESADELKKTTTEQNLTRLLAAIDRKLGPVKSAEANGWSVNYNSSGTSVTLKFKTQFEKGTGAETFVYRISGGKALLASYHINSEDLMIN